MKVNSEIQAFQEDLIAVTNQHNTLPVGVIYFVLKDCFNDIANAYHQIIEQEQSQPDSEPETTETISTDN